MHFLFRSKTLTKSAHKCNQQKGVQYNPFYGKNHESGDQVMEN